MTFPEIRPRLPLFGVALAAVLGIVAADYYRVDPLHPLFATGILALATVLLRQTPLAWALTFAAFFSLHTLRHHGNSSHALAESLEGRPAVATVTGVVWDPPAPPRTPSKTITCRFLLHCESIELGGEQRPFRGDLPVRWAAAPPVYGDRVQVIGTLHPPAPPRNPGQMDYAEYLRRQGVFLELTGRYASDCTVLEHDRGSALQKFAFAAQAWISHCLEIDLQDSPEVSALIESMVLGAHGEASDDIRELFQRTGTMHLFAVSGLNVMMLAFLAWYILKPLRVPRFHAVLIIIPLLAVYALITGLSASCVRATITGSIFFAGYVLDRRPLALNSLAGAALALLAWDTNQLFSTGFQFTFVIVLCLLGLASPVQRRVARLAAPDPFLPRRLWGWPQRSQAWCWGVFAAAFSVSLTSWCGSLPFTVGYFHLFSPAALFANLLAVPLAFVMLILAVASLVAAAVGSAGLATLGAVGWGSSHTATLNFLPALFNNANWLTTKALLFVLSFSAELPASYRYVEPSVTPAAPCEFTVLDVGNGGAIHLRASGQDWLLDCAHGYEYQRVLLPFLHTRGVNHLTGLLLSHGDSHHVGGAVSLLSDLPPRLILDGPLKDRSSAHRAIADALEKAKRAKRIVQRGETIEIGPGARFTVLYPPAGLVRSVVDDKALVVRVEAASRRVLFMSDAGFPTEQWLVENEPDLRADVLVKGQHSRELSGTFGFIQRVQPDLIISSAPEMDAKWESHEAWLREMRAMGITVFAQEECGAVHVALTPEGVRAETFVTAQSFRSRAR